MIHLADLSGSQPPSQVNYAAMSASGIRGVYCRLGEGLHDHDPAFVAHARACEAAGMRAGAYHVLAPSSGHPEDQAARLGTVAIKDALPPVVDVERNRPLGADAPAWLAFLRAYLKAAPRNTLVYTYASFLAELKAAGFKPEAECRGVWLARYPTLRYPSAKGEQLRMAVLSHMAVFLDARSKGDAPRAAAEARARLVASQSLSALNETPEPLGQPPVGAVAWQWGGDANASTVAGVRGLCDRSWFLGDEAAFAKFA